MVKQLLVSIVVAVMLSACNAQDSKVTGKQVVDAFVEAGINLENIKDETARISKSESPLPKSFRENWSFVDPVLGNGKGGQIFICDEKQLCDAIFAYYDVLKGLAGPYLYRNQDGTVVAQLNSGHTPDGAKRYQDVLSKL